MPIQKSPYSKCSECPLKSQSLVLGESSISKLKDVRLFILAEAPAANEVKDNKPLSENGKAGKVFRHCFEKSGLNKIPYVITNSVLCSNLDKHNKTDNPPKEAYDLCKSNWQTMVELCQPELIIALGSNAMNALGIMDPIGQVRNKIRYYKGIKIITLYHPSFIARNGGIKTDVGEKYLQSFIDIYNNHFDPKRENYETTYDEVPEGTEVATYNNNSSIELEHPYCINLPRWCYEDEMYLFDVQYNRMSNEIIYIFKYPNEVKYHIVPAKEFYCYKYKEDMNLKDAPILTSIKNVELIKLRPRREDSDKPYYESDVALQLKHSIDYKMQRKTDEVFSGINKMYYDIEIYNEGKKSFPDPIEAKSPINSISFKVNDGDTHIYIYKHNDMDVKPPIVPEGSIYKLFDTEKELILKFCEEIKKNSIMILCGWNSNWFDMPTIINRMGRLGMDKNKLSPLGYTSYNSEKPSDTHIYGLYCLDMLDLYKTITIPYGKEPSYKLSAIAQKHLGKDKVAYEGTLDELYKNDLSKFIEYSGTDTQLLKELDDKLDHISLRFELIKNTGSTWKNAETITGLLDPFAISYAKTKNIVCRNSLMSKFEKKIKGALVRTPKKGLHKYIIDLDYTSLYPSVICSLNLGPNTYIAKLSEDDAKTYLYDRENLEENIKIKFNPAKYSAEETMISKEKFLEFIKENDAIIAINGCVFTGHDKEKSFLNEMLTEVMNRRKEYKDKMKEAGKAENKELEKLYDNKQAVFKIISNSLYGTILQPMFRFFNMELGECITATGQEISKFAGYHVNKYLTNGDKSVDYNFIDKYENELLPYIIYGDTDSIYIALGQFLIDKNKIEITDL